MPLAFADRAYIVNLRDRTDRRREMEAELARVGLGDDPAVAFFEAVRPVDPGKFPSLGARGCFESQLGVLKRAAGEGVERLVLFEDDVDFCDDYASRAPSVAASLGERDWRLFYGGHEIVAGAQGAVRDGPFLRAPASVGVQTAHFVAFRGRETIATTIAFLEAIAAREPGSPLGGPMHVDGAYNWLRRAHPDWLVLLADPQLGRQRASRSDIAERRWYDRTPVVRDLVGALRRARPRSWSAR